MKKILFFIVFLLMTFQILGQTKKEVFQDTTIQKSKISHHYLGVELLGPGLHSSIGYVLEKPINEKWAMQYGFRLVFPVVRVETGVILKQTVLFGEKRVRLAMGFAEFATANIGTLTGKYDNRSPWDRPALYTFGASFNLGVEFNVIKDKFYITPEVNICYYNSQYYEADYNWTKPYNKIIISWVVPTFGINFNWRF